MPFNRMLWVNGTIATADHFNSIYTDIEHWIKKCINGPGIISIDIDIIMLKSNILKINYIEAIMNDLTYIKNENLILELKNIYQKTYISIEISDAQINTYNKSTQDQIYVNWTDITQTVKLIVNDIFPIAEIDIQNGEYILTSFEPKFIKYTDNHRIIHKCRALFTQVQHQIQKLQYSSDKTNIQILNNVLTELYIGMQVGTFDFLYAALLRSLTLISQNTYLLSYYTPNILNNICDKIATSLSMQNKSDYVTDFILNNNIYSARISKIGKIIIIIEPANIENKEWIESTIIASENMFEQASLSRVKGLNRTVTISNSIIVNIDITSEYFSMNQNLYILGKNLCISRISLYIE